MFDFNMNENQQMIAEMVRSFGAKEITPFRKEWDDKRGCWKDKPLHDWTSHGSDAFRYFAVAKSAKKPVKSIKMGFAR